MKRLSQICGEKANKEGMGVFSPNDLLFVVQAHMDFEEGQEEV